MATPRRQKQKPQGGSYPNRTDLRQAPGAASQQEYGKAKAQLDAQKVVPLSQAPAPGSVSPSLSSRAGMMGGGGQTIVPPLSAPSARPEEPITAGLPTGPGPGPEVLPMPQSQDLTLLEQLRGMYNVYPNDDIARLMSVVEARLDTNSIAPSSGRQIPSVPRGM
jgi:hypothetical protein